MTNCKQLYSIHYFPKIVKSAGLTSFTHSQLFLSLKTCIYFKYKNMSAELHSHNGGVHFNVASGKTGHMLIIFPENVSI